MALALWAAASVDGINSVASGSAPDRPDSRTVLTALLGTLAAAFAHSRLWHFSDIARSRMDFRFGCKSSHAADITAMTEFDPNRTYQCVVQGHSVAHAGVVLNRFLDLRWEIIWRK
jgi:hypothetical protein